MAIAKALEEMKAGVTFILFLSPHGLKCSNSAYQLDQLHARFRQRVLFEAGRASFLQKSSLPWTGLYVYSDTAEVEAYVFTGTFLRSVKTTVNEALLLASNLGLKTNKACLVALVWYVLLL